MNHKLWKFVSPAALALLLAACSDSTTAPSPLVSGPPSTPQFDVVGTTMYLSEVVASSQGLRKNGTPVFPERSNPAFALGAPDVPFFSLGFGGSFTGKFSASITGSLLIVFEQTNLADYPVEVADVFVSKNGTDFVLAGQVTNEAPKEQGLRQASVALPAGCWQYVRIVDVSPIEAFEPEADGFDLNAVAAQEAQVCVPYDWSLQKSGPTSVTVASGETKTITFTLEATRTGGPGEVDATATLEEMAADACTSLGAGFTCTPDAQTSWTLSGSDTRNFSFEITNTGAPCGSTRTMTNNAKLTETNSGSERTAQASVSVSTPTCPPYDWSLQKSGPSSVTFAAGETKTITFNLIATRSGGPDGIDATATLEEMAADACASLGAGFTCTPDTQTSWTLNGTTTQSFSFIVKNVSAPCGTTRTMTNNAKLTESTSGEQRTAQATVTVVTAACPPLPTGTCTRSQGYYKQTHHAWPAGFDRNSPFFDSGKTYQQIMNMNPADWRKAGGRDGNVYIQLAHQYIAAVLNRATLASTPAHINTAINKATLYFQNATPSGFNAGTTATLLDRFNNGLEGPQHCK